MDQLESLASITKLSGSVIRILGQNPGKFTLQGTNTYLIGKSGPRILIDTGEGQPEYIPVLEDALRQETKATTADPTAADVSDVIISHWHRDHVNGLPSVLALFRRLWTERNPSPPAGVTYRPPRLHKHPYVGVDPEASAVSAAYNSLPSILESLPPTDFTPSPTGQPFHDLHDGQIIGGMKVAHTPGHTTDSITLFVFEDRALYTADTVLGQGTAVFEDLADYISSLRKMLEGIRSEGGSVKLYPGHGPVVDDGAGRIDMYITHRLQREEGIIEVLRTSPPANNTVQGNESQKAEGWTVEDLVANIYAAYPRNLWGPAAHSIGLHLKKLEKEGRVEQIGNSWKYID